MKVDLALAEVPRADLVEGFSLGDARTVEGKDEYAASRMAHGGLDLSHEEDGLRDGTARDPRGFLAVNHVRVPIQAGTALGLDVRVVETRIAGHQRIRSVVGLGNGPAADI